MWKAKATSKTQQLILIYAEVDIYFISWTKFLLNNYQSSKTLKFSCQLSKLDKNDCHPSKLPPYWDPHSYCSLFNLKNFCYHSTGCCVHNISLLGFVWSNEIILIPQALSVVPTYNIVHSMWRISSVFSLRNLQHTVKRSNLNTVRLYHAEKGCFGYRPSLQVTDRGKHTSHLCTCRNYRRLDIIQECTKMYQGQINKIMAYR